MTLLSLPAWMEILVNVIGYAGFIGIATWHKSSDEITIDSPCVVIRGGDDPSQGSTHLTIDHILAQTEHWPRSPHVHFDEWQDRYYSDNIAQNAPRKWG